MGIESLKFPLLSLICDLPCLLNIASDLIEVLISHIVLRQGIPIRMPLDAIFEQADLLMLWTCHTARYNCLFVASFVVHDAALFRLRIIISLAYDSGHLLLLSQPDTEQENRMPIQETLPIQLANTNLFRYRVLFI